MKSGFLASLISYFAKEIQLRRFIRLVESRIDPASIRTVLDIGSLDLSAAIAFRKCWPLANVYAFECNPDALKICAKRKLIHRDIALYNYAVCDRNGRTDFYPIDPQNTVTTHRDGNIGASSMYLANPAYPYEHYAQDRIQVDGIRLDKWARQQMPPVESIDVIWMDIQGAELLALQGMGAMMQTVKIIQLEVEHRPVYLGQPLFSDIDKYLSRRGFKLIAEYGRSDWASDVVYVHE